jgi:hypothetical protein
MQNVNRIYKASFILSIIVFGTYLFTSPKVLIRFFVDRNNSEFFISDLNFFTYRYAYTNCFRVYLRYAPFVILFFPFILNKYFFRETYFKWTRFIRISLYAHMVAIFYNHYDFSNRINTIHSSFFASELNHIEFSYALIQYSGAYWDFFCVLLVYYGVIAYIRENCFAAQMLCYERVYFFPSQAFNFMLKKSDHFWLTMNYVWLFRLVTLLISRYFFCGEGILSDSIVVIVTGMCVEFTLFFFRVFCILKVYK